MIPGVADIGLLDIIGLFWCIITFFDFEVSPLDSSYDNRPDFYKF